MTVEVRDIDTIRLAEAGQVGGDRAGSRRKGPAAERGSERTGNKVPLVTAEFAGMKEPQLTRHDAGSRFFIDPPVIARSGLQRTGSEHGVGLVGAQHGRAGGTEVN